MRWKELWPPSTVYTAQGYIHCMYVHTHLPVTVINHDVVWFDISVHDAHTVAVVQGSQQLVEIVANVVVCQLLVQSLQ